MKPETHFRHAQINDIDGICALQGKYHVDAIDPELKKQGFVTTRFTREQMQDLIRLENGLFIAETKGRVIAYLMAASWAFWSPWPLFACMIEQLETVRFKGIPLNTQNSFQYGPVCIDESARGTGLLELLFAYALDAMSKRYAYLATFINKTNQRSLAAHTRKLNLEVIREFEFNDHTYYWLVCPTRPQRI